MYYRKAQDDTHRKRTINRAGPGFPYPFYYDDDKKRWIRCWKSDTRAYRWYKKQSHRYLRRLADRNLDTIYTNKSYDLWWTVW